MVKMDVWVQTPMAVFVMFSQKKKKSVLVNGFTMEWRMSHYNLVFLDSLDVIIILRIMCNIFSLFSLTLHGHSCNGSNQTKKVTHG